MTWMISGSNFRTPPLKNPQDPGQDQRLQVYVHNDWDEFRFKALQVPVLLNLTLQRLEETGTDSRLDFSQTRTQLV